MIKLKVILPYHVKNPDGKRWGDGYTCPESKGQDFVFTGQPGDKLPTAVTYDDFSVENAKSGRSTCRSCGEKIDKVRPDNVQRKNSPKLIDKHFCTSHAAHAFIHLSFIFSESSQVVSKRSRKWESSSYWTTRLVVPCGLFPREKKRTWLLQRDGCGEVT